jgi:hypothetical protein
MRIIWTTKEKWDKRTPRPVLNMADMIVVDGVIVKNRHGKLGDYIYGTLYIWAEREEQNESISERTEGWVGDCHAVPE